MRAKRFTLTPLLFFALLCLACKISPAQAQTPLRCPNGGIGGDPLVPDSETAKSIYVAVTKAVWPQQLTKFPVVVAHDQGDHWAVVNQTIDGSVPRIPQAPHPKLPPGQEDIQVTVGGGMFSMDIDKCTGAISHAQGNK